MTESRITEQRQYRSWSQATMDEYNSMHIELQELRAKLARYESVSEELPPLELSEADKLVTMEWSPEVEGAVNNAVPVSWLVCRERQLQEARHALRVKTEKLKQAERATNIPEWSDSPCARTVRSVLGVKPTILTVEEANAIRALAKGE